MVMYQQEFINKPHEIELKQNMEYVHEFIEELFIGYKKLSLFLEVDISFGGYVRLSQYDGAGISLIGGFALY